MTEPDPHTEVAVVVSFLERFLADREQNATRTLAEYQSTFPGYEAVIAREYEAAMNGSAVPAEDGSPRLEQLRHEGEVSGRYERHEEIARGGMGRILRVWDRDLKRSLAMKVMAAGDGESASHASGSQALQRFLLEAQITGQLEHPGIVPVHDLGIGSDGRVYFTMSMVQGRNLQEIIGLVQEGRDDWTTTRALNVVLRVCEAVAFAHSKGVIHRDLKPSNVMIGQFGETYVMDWGLARVLDQRLDDANRSGTGSGFIDVGEISPLMTMQGDVIGTPAYMAPEQARGDAEHVGTRSDVYAIGAMIYHLLAGGAPYASSTGKLSSESVLPLVKEGPPEPLHSILPDVPGELVAICEKAMAREPDDRYPEVMALADELRAFLETRVVHAYETGAWAELRKWVRRNKRFAITGALGVVALVVGLAVALVEKERADETAARLASEKQWSLEFAFDVLGEMGTNLARDELRELPGAQALRLRVLENTKKFYEEFLAKRGSDPRIRKQTARAYGSLAEIHKHVGSYPESRRAAEQAIRLFRALVDEEPNSLPERLNLAQQQLLLAGLFGSLRELPKAAGLMQEAAAGVRAILDDHTEDPDVPHTLAQILYSHAVILDRMKRTEERDAKLREVLRLQEQLVRDRPKRSKFQQNLARTYTAQILYLSQTRSAENAAAAEAFATKAEQIYLDLLEREKGVARYRVGLGNLYTFRAIHRRRQGVPNWPRLRYDDHLSALKYREDLVKEFPSVASYVGDYGASLSNVGGAFLDEDRAKKARPFFERAIAESRKALKLMPDHMIYQSYLCRQIGKLTHALNLMKLHREAEALIDDMFEVEPDPALAHSRASRILADCTTACENDDKLTDAERAEQRESYASRSVAHMQKAHDGGYSILPQLGDRVFDSVRDRDDFKRIEALVKGR